MKIAINLINTYNNDPAVSVFTCECWQDIAKLKPDHQFIFLADSKTPVLTSAENVDVRVVKRTGLAWLDRIRLKRALVRVSADCVINILQTGFEIKRLSNNKRSKVAGHQRRLLLFESNGGEHTQDNEQHESIIKVKPAYKDVFKELSWTEAESIKTSFTGGRSFFLFAGNIAAQHQLIELLKAFSVFKKWQQSNMQLVITGYSTGWTNVLEEKLQQYKFRADVVLLKNPAAAVLEKLVAASYAVVVPFAANVFCPFVSLAVQSGKALIISDQPINRGIIPVAEWVDINETAAGFSKAMILLYKNEKHLQSLERQSKQAAVQLNRSEMLDTFWDAVGN